MLILAYWGSYFKSERQVHEYTRLVSNAAEAGWDTCLVLSRPPADPGWLIPLRDRGTQLVYVRRPRRNFDLRCALTVRALCHRLDCCVVHCDNIHTSPLIGAALARVPVRIWSKRSMEPMFEQGRAPSVRDRAALAVRTSCALAVRTLAVSSAVREELLRLGIPARKVVTFHDYPPPGVARRHGRDEARRQWGYPDAAVVITAVGRAVPVKGWDTLITAFAQVVTALPQARLLLVGDLRADPSAYGEKLRKLVSRLGLESKVRFTGHLPDISDALAASDLFVMPSRSEGFGGALIEGLQAGLPCVATRVGIAPDIIRDGVSGLLVDRAAPKQLAAALARLVTDPALRRRLGHSAAQRLPLPTLDEYSARLMTLYRELLNDQGVAAHARPVASTVPTSRAGGDPCHHE